MLTRYGFGKPTGIPLQGETPGLLRSVSQWSLRSKPTIAMGQEIGVSALQMMAAATVLTNGGVLLKPQIVKKIVSPQGTVVKEFGREPLWEVISPRSAQTMLEWMETATFLRGLPTGWRSTGFGSPPRPAPPRWPTSRPGPIPPRTSSPP